MTRHLGRLALPLVLGIALTSNANAGPIQGELSFVGNFVPTGGTGLMDATGFSFPGSDMLVMEATGDLDTYIDPYNIGTLYDVDFTPSPGDDNKLWSIGGFTFSMDSIKVKRTPTTIVLSGIGEISGNGFDATRGRWNLTGNTLGTLFSFSAGTASVPEPGSLALIGAGLLGMLARRRKPTREGGQEPLAA